MSQGVRGKSHRGEREKLQRPGRSHGGLREESYGSEGAAMGVRGKSHENQREGLGCVPQESPPLSPTDITFIPSQDGVPNPSLYLYVLIPPRTQLSVTHWTFPPPSLLAVVAAEGMSFLSPLQLPLSWKLYPRISSVSVSSPSPCRMPGSHRDALSPGSWHL